MSERDWTDADQLAREDAQCLCGGRPEDDVNDLGHHTACECIECFPEAHDPAERFAGLSERVLASPARTLLALTARLEDLLLVQSIYTRYDNLGASEQARCLERDAAIATTEEQLVVALLDPRPEPRIDGLAGPKNRAEAEAVYVSYGLMLPGAAAAVRSAA
jgi:hypothetical protein